MLYSKMANERLSSSYSVEKRQNDNLKMSQDFQKGKGIQLPRC